MIGTKPTIMKYLPWVLSGIGVALFTAAFIPSKPLTISEQKKRAVQRGKGNRRGGNVKDMSIEDQIKFWRKRIDTITEGMKPQRDSLGMPLMPIYNNADLRAAEAKLADLLRKQIKNP